MIDKRTLLKFGIAAGVLTGLGPVSLSHADSGLAWKHFPAGGNGFFRAPVLITGSTEALLIDGGFSYPDGAALVAEIKATGKTLTTIYISQSDPDFYFSLKPVKEAFPDARVIAAPETVQAIKGNVEKKLAVWGPKLGEHGPQTLADIVMPEEFDGPTLSVDDETVEIVPADGLANRRYLYVPSLDAVFGGVLVFSGTHVWTADTPTPEQRQAWVHNLEKILEKAPATVIPGHMTPDALTGLAAVRFTRSYLLAFDEELAKAPDAAGLKAAMENRFPDLDMGVALDIGSKVATGEMKWG